MCFDRIKKLFTKKKEPFRFDAEIKLNVKTMCLFEQLADKSFMDFNENDIILLLYASLVANNNMLITYNAFVEMLNDTRIARWFTKEYTRISKFNGQLSFTKKNNEASGEGGISENMTIMDYAANLIIQYGMDAHYVMNEMQLFEMERYFKVADAMKKDELTEQRLFTYLQMSPHLNPKKRFSPEDILPFPWEKDEKKKRKIKDLEDKSELIKKILGNGTR